MDEINQTELIFERMDENFYVSDYNFDSGVLKINNFYFNEIIDYLKGDYLQAYLLYDKNDKQLIGYITLSACFLKRTTERIKKKFLKKGYIPGILIGRLGIDKRFKREHFGSYLINKAIKISSTVSKKIGCRILLTEAKTNKDVLLFYRKLNFKFKDLPLGLSIIEKIVNSKNVEKNTIQMYYDLHKFRSSHHD